MQLLKDCLFVGMGGFIGAIMRYLLTLVPVKLNFPLMTLIVNLSGAVLIGIIAGAAANMPNINASLVMFLKTGVCGGYTTLSTMALDTVNLFKGGHHLSCAVYVILIVVLCVLGVLLGEFIASVIFKKA